MKHLRIWLGIGIGAVVVAVIVSTILFDTTKNKPSQVPNTGIPETEISNEAFRDAFPEQYESYKKTAEVSDTTSKFVEEKEPLLPVLFSGYTFGLDYQESRGHSYAIDDLMDSLRVSEKTPGSCLTCKSSAAPQLIEEMGEDYWTASLTQDIMPEAELKGHAAIGCSDCHNPSTMELRVTRPSFIKKMSDMGIDVSRASKKDMRNYVCGQCHSEYYFNGKNGEVTHPWDSGYDSIGMYVYYETIGKENNFEHDYISDISGTPIIKANHPEFESYMGSTHAENGVSCSDCHMPTEEADNGKKITSHFLTSPLASIETSCGSCHSGENIERLKTRVNDIQSNFKKSLDEAQELSVQAHYYVNKMISSGADASEIGRAQTQIRFGQWHWDYTAAENSSGFHNPEGSLNSLRISKNASNEAIAIATTELKKKNVDLKELDAQIEKIKKSVIAEKEMSKKNLFTTNNYFPAQK